MTQGADSATKQVAGEIYVHVNHVGEIWEICLRYGVVEGFKGGTFMYGDMVS